MVEGANLRRHSPKAEIRDRDASDSDGLASNSADSSTLVLVSDVEELLGVPAQ